MAIATLTSKGQVTIPKKVREQLRLKQGDRLDFRLEADGSLRVQPISLKVAEVFGAFRNKAAKPLDRSEVKVRLRKAFRGGKL